MCVGLHDQTTTTKFTACCIALTNIITQFRLHNEYEVEAPMHNRDGMDQPAAGARTRLPELSTAASIDAGRAVQTRAKAYAMAHKDDAQYNRG